MERQLTTPRSAEVPSLADAVEDVASSLRDVVEQRLELLRLDVEAGLTRAALGLALLLFASGFAGVFFGAVWSAAMAGLLWLARDSVGLPVAIAALVLLHGALGAGIAVAARRGLARHRAAEARHG
jgi:hypothetical protein